MTHIHCTIQRCKWGITDVTEIAISSYLAHVIKEHWGILQYAHDHPEALQKALADVNGLS